MKVSMILTWCASEAGNLPSSVSRVLKDIFAVPNESIASSSAFALICSSLFMQIISAEAQKMMRRF
jgi:hypothetical protein